MVVGDLDVVDIHRVSDGLVLGVVGAIIMINFSLLLMGEGEVQMVGGYVEMGNGVVAEDGFFEDELVSVEGEDFDSGSAELEEPMVVGDGDEVGGGATVLEGVLVIEEGAC